MGVLVRGVGAGALLLAFSACGGASRGDVDREPATNGMSAAEIEALYQARTDSARLRFTEADVRFATDMISHHAQALAMASLVPESGASPSIRTLAARITNAQQDEIETMERWLSERGLEPPDVRVEGTSVIVGGAEHVHSMPGMLSPEQMDRLAMVRGTEFERLFLAYMIQHHEGAVHMVDQLVSTDGAVQDEEMFRLAADIRVDQVTEIARMRSMLEAMGGMNVR